MEEVLDASKVVVIDNGVILAQGSSEELRAKYSNDRVKIIPKNGLEKISRRLIEILLELVKK